MLSELSRLSKEIKDIVAYLDGVKLYGHKITDGEFTDEYLGDVLYRESVELEETVKSLKEAVQIIGSGDRF